MIAVRLEGKLGNQLFQYAFIYTLSKKLNTKFYLDKSVDYLLIDKYFNIDKDFCYPFDKYIFSKKGFKNLFSHHLRYVFYRAVKNILNLKTINFDNLTRPSIQMELISNNSIYQGFFQSEEYFERSHFKINDILKIKDIYKKEFEEIIIACGLPEKYVVVHVRRGDYIEHGLALDYKYFHNAIDSIHKGENFYVFISDEPEIIASEFRNIKAKYISDNKEIVDFQFLVNAETCIISNSTFSWWGAYLNIKNPYVIAPRYWLGFKEKKENPVGIIPERFTVLSL